MMLVRKAQRNSLSLEHLEGRQLLTTVPFLNELTELHANDLEQSDHFATSFGYAGNIAVIGAPGDDDNGRDSGSAYVFHHNENGTPTNPNDDTWTQLAKLTPDNGARNDRFGSSVGVFGNDTAGYTVVVAAVNAQGAARNSGAAYVFTGYGSAWTQRAKLYASDGAKDDDFGDSHSVSIQGSTIVIAAELHDSAGSQAGAVYVYEDNSTTGDWSFPNAIDEFKLTAADTQAGDHFGKSIAIAGDTIVVGADGAGATYAFERIAGTWVEQAKLTRTDGGPLGRSVAVSETADTVIASSGSEVFAFVKPGQGWIDKTEDAEVQPDESTEGFRFGWSLSLSGDTLVVGAVTAPNGGAAYVFDGSGANWTWHTKLVQTDGEGGLGGSVFTDGQIVLVDDANDDAEPLGIQDAGSLYVFPRDPAAPTPGITVSPTAGLITDEGGGSASFTVVLDTEPNASVSIDLYSSDITEGELVGAVNNSLTLSFDSSNWDQPQTVTARGVDDALADGDIEYDIITAAAISADPSYGGLNPTDIAITNWDDDSPIAITMHASDLDGSSSLGSRGKWNAMVTITVLDEYGNPVANAVVEGSWSAGVSGSSTCTTDGNGQCTVTKNNVNKNIASVTFSVTGITHATYVYEPLENEDPDGDSDGTSIIVLKP